MQALLKLSRGIDWLNTQVGKYVVWLILASTPLHLVWCRPTVFVGMAVYGVALNVPFIIVQRANRGRLDRILSRRRRR